MFIATTRRPDYVCTSFLNESRGIWEIGNVDTSQGLEKICIGRVSGIEDSISDILPIVITISLIFYQWILVYQPSSDPSVYYFVSLGDSSRRFNKTLNSVLHLQQWSQGRKTLSLFFSAFHHFLNFHIVAKRLFMKFRKTIGRFPGSLISVDHPVNVLRFSLYKFVIPQIHLSKIHCSIYEYFI